MSADKSNFETVCILAHLFLCVFEVLLGLSLHIYKSYLNNIDPLMIMLTLFYISLFINKSQKQLDIVNLFQNLASLILLFK